MRGQQTGQGHLLLLPLGKFEDRLGSQILQAKFLQGIAHGRDAYGALHPPALQRNGRLVLHRKGKKLGLGVLKQRAHQGADFRQGPFARVVPVDERPTCKKAVVILRCKAVQQSNKSRLAAAAAPRAKHQLARPHRKIDIRNSRRGGLRVGVGNRIQTQHAPSPSKCLWSRHKRPEGPQPAQG